MMRISYTKQLYNLYTSDQHNNNFEICSIVQKEVSTGPCNCIINKNMFLKTSCLKIVRVYNILCKKIKNKK